MSSREKCSLLSSHYSSISGVMSIPTPGFAASSAGQSGHVCMTSLSTVPTGSAPVVSGDCLVKFLANASISYKSHFSDSAPGAAPVIAVAGCAGGVASKASLSGSAGVSASFSGFAGSPIFSSGGRAIGDGSRARNNSSSDGSSVTTTSASPVVKLTPPQMCTAAPPTLVPDSSGVSSGADAASAGTVVVAEANKESTFELHSESGIGFFFHRLCSASSSSSPNISQLPKNPLSKDSTCLSHRSSHLPEVGADNSGACADLPAEARRQDKGACGVSWQSNLFTPSQEDACVSETGTAVPSNPILTRPPTSCDSVASTDPKCHANDASVPSKTLDSFSKGRWQQPSSASHRHHRKECRGPCLTDPPGSTTADHIGDILPGQDAPVIVYDSQLHKRFSIPASQVLQIPHPSLGVSRLVLCPNFSPDNPSACSEGSTCGFVHADTRNAACCSVHVNLTWRSLHLCTYPRLPAGDELTVFAPNEQPPSEKISSDLILVTHGSTDWRKQTSTLSHCSQYFFDGICDFGERCKFIHTVHVDSSAAAQCEYTHLPISSMRDPMGSTSLHSTARCAAREEQTVVSSRHQPVNRRGSATQTPPVAMQASLLPSNSHSGTSVALPASGGGTYAFAPNCPPLPHCAVENPLLGHTFTSATTGGASPSVAGVSEGAPHIVLLSRSGQRTASSRHASSTLMPPTSQQMSSSDGIFSMAPRATETGGLSAENGAPVRSLDGTASFLGQSLGSLTAGHIGWSFYEGVEASASMTPPSPRT